MECTQKLECTQDLNLTQSQRSGPNQIGMLGICGDIYPINIGPNKIGRDPQTCDIALDVKSLSRQHAVINVLNKKQFMLMDLGSVNKTKLGIKTLQAYMPYPLANGDTVQFGDVFGVFRLCDDDNDLPMTQNIDVPDTPMYKHVSRLNSGHATTVPESPEISDKEESFIAPSQKPDIDGFKSPNSHFIKPSGRTITKPVIGAKKIENIFWKSRERSPSLNFQLDKSDDSLNNSEEQEDLKGIENIHEMDTQVPPTKTVDSIHIAETQLPNISGPNSPSIYSLQTQLPTVDNLPEIQKINEQDMNYELSLSSKIKKDIHDLETQPFVKSINDAETQLFNNKNDEELNVNKDENIHELETQAFGSKFTEKLNSSNKSITTTQVKSAEKQNTTPASDDEILFDDIDGADFDGLDSQPILSENSPLDVMPVCIKNNLLVNEPQNGTSPIVGSNKFKVLSLTKSNIDLSNVLTQQIQEKEIAPTDTEVNQNTDNEVSSPTLPAKRRSGRAKSDSSTDCEDLASLSNLNLKQPVSKNNSIESNSQTDSPMLRSRRKSRKLSSSSSENEDIHILPTQIIEQKNDTAKNLKSFNKSKESNEVSKVANKDEDVFEEMATQILDDIEEIDKTNFEDMTTQILETDNIKDNDKSKDKSKEDSFNDMLTQIIQEDDLKTDIPKVEESQNKFSEELIMSPFKVPLISQIKTKKKETPKKTAQNKTLEEQTASTPLNENYYDTTQEIIDDLVTQKYSDEIVPCSIENESSGDRFRHIDDEGSPRKQSDNNKETSVTVSKLRKQSSSELSDFEETPKKSSIFTFSNLDFPDSQDIKSNVSSKIITDDPVSDSEPELNSSEEHNTPILFQKEKKPRKIKANLLEKFDSIPTRISTRVKIPSEKLLNIDKGAKINSSLVKHTIISEQEEDIDKEIVLGNLSKLKSKISPTTKTEISSNSKQSKGNKKREKYLKCTDIAALVNKPDANINTSNQRSTRNNEMKQLDTNTKKVTDQPKKSQSPVKNKASKSNPPAKNKSKTKNNSKRSDSPVNDKSDNSSIAEINIERPKTPIVTKKNSKAPIPKKAICISPKERPPSRSNRRRKGSPIPQETTRRSKRQKNTNTQRDVETETDPEKKPLKPILKKTKPEEINQSTVYNESLEVSKCVKRSATESILEPSTKRTRNKPSTRLRNTPARNVKAQKVLFTAFTNQEVKDKLEKLGAIIVTEVTECTVLVTLQIKRTFKLLCAVGLGRPIVGPDWVQACADNNMVVDPWLYLIRDEATENRFLFNLRQTLSGKRNFLKGYNVSSTPGVLPKGAEMKVIVESSGGTWKEGGSKWICISCLTDKTLWEGLKKKGATLVTSEFILAGVLKQKLEIEANKLC